MFVSILPLDMIQLVIEVFMFFFSFFETELIISMVFCSADKLCRPSVIDDIYKNQFLISASNRKTGELPQSNFPS